MSSTQAAPRCKHLVLDAGPLLSLSPLRGLAETYLTVPQVLAELKDSRAREHFEHLGLMSGVNVEVKTPDAASLSDVIQMAKKTGDYFVLSYTDLCVLALTHSLHEQGKVAKDEGKSANASPTIQNEIEQKPDTDTPSTVDRISQLIKDASLEEPAECSSGQAEDIDELLIEEELEPLNVELHPLDNGVSALPSTGGIQGIDRYTTPEPLYDDPSQSDDGEGEWITPTNVGLHKSRALSLLPDDAGAKSRRKDRDEVIYAGCMTADFAMQNVLLQMGLSLVSVDGKKIEKVKTWVLRCHACFKICKDSSKKFCPSCGNPSLLRASVTISSPTASSDAPAMQVHLKPNFQYRIRGTKYSIPSPKPGSAKTGTGEGLVLREDQIEYMRAKKHADGKRQRYEAKMLKGILDKGPEGAVGYGGWTDPDWIPEIMSAGTGGKGRTVRNARMDGDMPVIGYGKKNPNERRRRK